MTNRGTCLWPSLGFGTGWLHLYCQRVNGTRSAPQHASAKRAELTTCGKPGKGTRQHQSGMGGRTGGNKSNAPVSDIHRPTLGLNPLQALPGLTYRLLTTQPHGQKIQCGSPARHMQCPLRPPAREGPGLKSVHSTPRIIIKTIR